MREGAFARESVEDMDVRSKRATGNQVIRDVGAVARLVSGRARHRDQLTESRTTVREIVAKGADADRERRLHPREVDRRLLGEFAFRERVWCTECAINQRVARVE